ncbi:unnamed protein product [Lampetra fluviatilis]
MAAQGGEREEKTAMRSPEETSRSGVPFGSRPRRASPYFQTLAVSDSQRPELASLSSREDLDHCLSERYEEEMVVRAEALVNSGRRLVQSYEQEKIRLADELLHVHVLLSEECRDPRSHGRLDDVVAAEPPNHRLDGRPPTDRQPTGAHTE